MTANRTEFNENDHDEKSRTSSAQTGYISNEDLRVFKLVVNVAFSGTFGVLGTVCNVINIIVFIKQGLNNTVNISMLAVAVSDVCSLVTLEWVIVTVHPFVENTNIPFEPFDITYITGAWPHACFLQITIWITVYVTAERFVCIALPLKVKQIFTPLRTKVIISLIYFLMFLALSPEYVTFYFGENFYLARNQTRVGLKVRDSTPNLDNLVFMLFAVMGLVSFFVLTLFTCLLVTTLNKRSQWRRKSSTNQEKSQSISTRDRRTMKMVSLVAGALLVCAGPGKCLSAIMFVDPGFNFTGDYASISHVSWALAYLAENVSSTVNIVFFYNMSSKYKHTFHELMSGCSRNCHGCDSSKSTSQ